MTTDVSCLCNICFSRWVSTHRFVSVFFSRMVLKCFKAFVRLGAFLKAMQISHITTNVKLLSITCVPLHLPILLPLYTKP